MIPASAEKYVYYREKDIVLLHGDCLEILPLFEPDSVDLVLTDPPYGINIANNPFRQAHEKSDWDIEPINETHITAMLNVSLWQIIWGGNYFPLPPSQGFFVWDKVQPEDFSSAMCEMAWTNKQTPAKIFKKRVTAYKKFHPTQKPDELMKWCIDRFIEPIDLILDPFLGSGTTAVAAKQLGRKCIGIEIEQKYLDIAIERLKQEVLF